MNAEPVIQPDDLARDLQRHLRLASTPAIEFIAQGEYTLNYRIRGLDRDLVARVVTGSQMGLSVPDQVAYEAHALALLEPTGRTPASAGLEIEPADIPYPYLLMQYLPGRPLDYRTDLEVATRCVARIHRLGVPDGHRLQVHAEPERIILADAEGLLDPYLAWSGAEPDSAAALRDLAGCVREHAAARPDVFDDADLAVINTDLNTHNFLVDGQTAYLLDWEKARIGPTVQDLAHFLLPTTTRWRTSTSALLSRADEEHFLATYLDERPELDGERYRAQLDAMRALALLRALAWCAWAVYASETGQRMIVNEETLGRCREYLEPGFLRRLTDTIPTP